MNVRKSALIAAGTFLMFASIPAFADIINGDFSDGLAGWEIGKGASYVTNGQAFSAVGTNEQLSNPFAVLLLQDGDGIFAQDFVTVPGIFYRISFDFGALGSIGQSQTMLFLLSTGLPDTGPLEFQYSALVTNDLSSTFTRHSLIFRAETNTSSIDFFPQDDQPSVSAVLDNVSVNSVAAVPEPASWAMLIAGFGLVGFLQRRRARTNIVAA